MTQKKFHNPKTFRNYTYAIISLSFMLYWLGMLGVVTIYSSNMVTYLRENIPFYIELKDDAHNAEVFKYQKQLEASTFVKQGSVRYISKEEAAEEMESEGFLTHEDIYLFGENILPNMIGFNVKSEYLEQRNQLVKDIEQRPFVETAFYFEAATQNLSTSLYQLGAIILILALFFVFVSVTLIKNTLKLLILSNNQLIETMQLVGAQWEYMSKPYLQQSVRNSVLSAVLAIAAILLTVAVAQFQIDGLAAFAGTFSLLSVCLLLVIISIFVSWGCTKHSIYKYLRNPEAYKVV